MIRKYSIELIAFKFNKRDAWIIIRSFLIIIASASPKLLFQSKECLLVFKFFWVYWDLQKSLSIHEMILKLKKERKEFASNKKISCIFRWSFHNLDKYVVVLDMSSRNRGWDSIHRYNQANKIWVQINEFSWLVQLWLS